MRVLLAVSGGIAAYKSAEIVRAFVKRGDEVRVVMTESATEFITPLTLQVLSSNRVGLELFDPTYESEIGHIELARWPDVVLVAPATANTIAKLAHGFSDNLLTTVICATTAPVVVAPAMNTQMYLDAAVQRNLQTLRDLGYALIDPDLGELACKEVGPGRLPDADVLVSQVVRATLPSSLGGKRVVVTAGPTREHVDPARFLSNPSSGRMGFELARAAQAFGAEVTLVSGPTELVTPYGVHRVDVTSAAEMYEAVMEAAKGSHVVVKAAAVADWKPRKASERKAEKVDGPKKLELVRTKDILSELARLPDAERPLLVGFAAESHDVEARGITKRDRKDVDVIVANKIGGPNSTFASADAHVCFVTASGAEWLEIGSKEAVAREIWSRVVGLLPR